MPKLQARLPKYRRHLHSGQAVVTLNGQDHYLGPHGTEVSKQEYDRLVGEWLAHGRQSDAPFNPQPVTINQIILEFWEHAQRYYRKPDGTATSELKNFRQALRPLRKLYGRTSAPDFGPLALKGLRTNMIELDWSRKYINKQVDRIKSVFKWAASEEKLPASIYEQLRTVSALKRGRTEARETSRIQPVPEEQILAVRPYVSRQVWALIQLQLLTGARAGELVVLCGIDLHTQESIWTVEPQEHKTAYREQAKTIYVGPQAQAILREFLTDRPLDAYLFSPAEAEAERRTAQHARRKTALSCGSRPGSNRKASPKRQPADRYTVDSYRRAIERACDRAFPPSPPLACCKVPAKKGMRWETTAEWSRRLGPAGLEELQRWRRAHRWHPHQLRHNAATRIRKEFGVEVARVILGHRSASVTEIYAEMDRAKATEVIKKIG